MATDPATGGAVAGAPAAVPHTAPAMLTATIAVHIRPTIAMPPFMRRFSPIRPQSTDPPRPPPEAGFGRLGGLRRYRADPPGALAEAGRRCGDVATFRIGPYRVHPVAHPDLASRVLVADAASFHKGQVLRAARALLGDGLLTSEGDLHRRQRRLLAPAFRRASLVPHAAAMAGEAEAVGERWGSGGVVDVHAEMQRLTLRLVAGTLFGSPMTGRRVAQVSGALDDALAAFPLLALPWGDRLVRLPLPPARRFRHARRTLDDVAASMVVERRGAGPGPSEDLLDVLLRDADASRAAGARGQVRDEIVSFLVAGHETTAVALSWAWHLLATHPQEDERMAAELAPLPPGPIGPEALPGLRATRAVVLETLRLYPPAWVIPRRATGPVRLGGYDIAPGSSVIVCPWHLHRDPRFWRAPERFDPGRFAGTADAPAPLGPYVAFGAGPRACIGREFAMMEATLILATLARRFRPRPAPGAPPRPEFGFTLRPAGGMRIMLERR